LTANAAHLTRRGDYTDAVSASAAEHAAVFAAANPLHSFGIYEPGQLVGSARVPSSRTRDSAGVVLGPCLFRQGLLTLIGIDTDAPWLATGGTGGWSGGTRFMPSVLGLVPLTATATSSGFLFPLNMKTGNDSAS
jgi:hypothetical protein